MAGFIDGDDVLVGVIRVGEWWSANPKEVRAWVGKARWRGPGWPQFRRPRFAHFRIARRLSWHSHFGPSRPQFRRTSQLFAPPVRAMRTTAVFDETLSPSVSAVECGGTIFRRTSPKRSHRIALQQCAQQCAQTMFDEFVATNLVVGLKFVENRRFSHHIATWRLFAWCESVRKTAVSDETMATASKCDE